MPKLVYPLILLAFLISPLVWAKETKNPASKISPNQEEPAAYQKLTAEQLEWLLKVKGHLNPLQVVPILNKEHLQLDLGPGQFQFTFPFR